MKTIAHYLEEEIKTHQHFIYNQIVKINQYRSIVIGPIDVSPSEFPFEHYFNSKHIVDINAFLTEQQVIAIHVHHGKHVTDILPLCIEHGIPVVVSLRGRDGSSKHKSFKRNVARYSTLIHHGALYLPVCQYLAKEMEVLGFPPEKIHVLYGGIDLDTFSYQERSLPVSEDHEIRIISVGRFVEKKGFDTLIKAFNSVHAHYPNTRLHIIGSGSQEKKLRSLINQLSLTDAVVLRGPMNAQQISMELNEAHLFSLPSRVSADGDVEGIPNALKEAMACGLPVISTMHGGIPELIEHQVTGYLVPENDDAELANGLMFFIQNPAVWKQYTERARKVIEEKFDINKQIREQQKLYALLEEEIYNNKN